jgi:hypothetical protein
MLVIKIGVCPTQHHHNRKEVPFQIDHIIHGQIVAKQGDIGPQSSIMLARIALAMTATRTETRVPRTSQLVISPNLRPTFSISLANVTSRLFTIQSPLSGLPWISRGFVARSRPQL